MSPWKETTHRTFTRPLGENETFLKMAGDPGLPLGRENYAINFTASISSLGNLTAQDLPAVLRRAWMHLRFQHPSFAIYVAEDGGKVVYKAPTHKELDEWVEQTFVVVEEAGSAEEVIQTIKAGPYAKLFFIPRTGEVLGHTSHWRADGVGVFLLLDALLKLVVKDDLGDPAELAWGEEPSRLTPAVEDALGNPLSPNPEQEELAKSLVGTFGKIAGAVGIPYLGDRATLPRGTLTANAVLSSSATEKVVAESKKRGISVTAAAHASVAAANWASASDDQKDRHYASTIRFNLRPYLLEPYGTAAYAAGLYTTGWTDQVESSGSWAEHAAAYQAQYRKGLSKEQLDSHRAYQSGLVDLLKNFPPDLPAPSEVDISSIGVIERFMARSYGSEERGIEVRSVSIGVEILTAQAIVYVWTFRDQLNLSVMFNEAYHEREQMEGFVKTVKSVLLQELGVTEEDR